MAAGACNRRRAPAQRTSSANREGGDMLFRHKHERAAFCLLSGFAVAPAAAQSYPCDESMILGKWVMVLGAETSNLVGPGMGVSCQVTIGTNGALTTSSCANLGPSMTITAPPKGTLTIDSTCYVHGTVSYRWTNNGVCPFGTVIFTYNEAMSPQLWRSLDGSRLSGYASDNVSYASSNSKCGSSGTTKYNSLRADFILIPQPPP